MLGIKLHSRIVVVVEVCFWENVCHGDALEEYTPKLDQMKVRPSGSRL